MQLLQECQALKLSPIHTSTHRLYRSADAPHSGSLGPKPAVVHQALYDTPLHQVSANHQVGLVIEPSKHGVPFALAVDLRFDTDAREPGQLSTSAALPQPPSPASGLFSLQYILEGASAQV